MIALLLDIPPPRRGSELLVIIAVVVIVIAVVVVLAVATGSMNTAGSLHILHSCRFFRPSGLS